MNHGKKWTFFLLAILLLTGATFQAALADHDEDNEREKNRKDYRKGDKHDREKYLPPVTNESYKTECGACHFVYQPGLLPSGSWKKIVNGLPDHFGEVVELDPDSKKGIEEYLTTNAAENCSAKRSRKIMKSLRGRTPLRITEISYIQEKHEDISSQVFKRESIGSFSNCLACHTSAEKGIYDDDYVAIPK